MLLESRTGAVGHTLRVQLVRTDVEKGYIDFKKVG
jgi:hypothetical protein